VLHTVFFLVLNDPIVYAEVGFCRSLNLFLHESSIIPKGGLAYELYGLHMLHLCVVDGVLVCVSVLYAGAVMCAFWMGAAVLRL